MITYLVFNNLLFSEILRQFHFEGENRNHVMEGKKGKKMFVNVKQMWEILKKNIQRKGEEVRPKGRMEGKKKEVAIEGKKLCLNNFIFYIEMIGLL